MPFRCFATRFAKICLLAAVTLAVGMTPAEAAKHKHHTKKVSAATLNAQASSRYASLVIDASSGKVLQQTAADEPRHPASLTKMMTLYLTFAALERGQIHLSDRMYVSSLAEAQSPSKLGLHAGDRLKVEDAILGIVTQSANDAAVVLAETLGGSEARFSMMMTETARKLGMTNTIYKNANGLPNVQQVTTARDQAKLGLALIRHYPQYYPYFSKTGFTYEGSYFRNHNRLMSRYEGMDGIKTGFINASGFNLVASVKRNDRRLIAVIFGGTSAASRDVQMAKLLDQGFVTADGMDAPLKNASIIAPDDKKTVANFTAPLPLRKPEAVASNDNKSALPASTGAQSVNFTDDGAGGAAEGDADLTPEPAVMTQAAAQKVVDSEPKNGWGIQVGAYNDRGSGQRALAIIADQNPDLLNRAETRVLAVDTASGTIYRARMVGLTQDAATRACNRLSKQEHPCLTLPPNGAPQAWLASAQ